MNSNELIKRLNEKTNTGDLRLTRIMSTKKELPQKILKIFQTLTPHSLDKAYILALEDFNVIANKNFKKDTIVNAISEIENFRILITDLFNAIQSNEDIQFFRHHIQNISVNNYKKLALYCGLCENNPNNSKDINISKFLNKVSKLKRTFFLLEFYLNNNEITYYSKTYEILCKEIENQNKFMNKFCYNLTSFNENEIFLFILLYDIKAPDVLRLKK